MRQPVEPEEDHGHQGYDIVGLTWSHNFSPSSFITVRPYRFTTRFVLDALAPDSLIGSYQNYGTNQLGLQTEYTSQLNSRHLLKTGASFIRSNNRYLTWIPDLGVAYNHPEWGDYAFNSNVNTLQTGIFIQDQADFGSRWHGEFGLRYDAMKFNKVANPDVTNSQISPRLGLSYKIDNNNVIKTSWGRFIQFPPSNVMEKIYNNPVWETYRLSNADLKPERSTSWDISWERQLNNTTMARITPFYRAYTDLLQSRRVDPDDPSSYVYTYANSGRGKSTGIEFYMLKKATKKWDGWISYTWQRARANASDYALAIDPSIWSYCNWDQRHTLNLVAAYRTKNWEHNWQLSYGSGLADISTTLAAAAYQDHTKGSAIVSWSIIRKLPEDSPLGSSIALNIWNVFNVGKPLQRAVYPDGSKEVASYIVPRFVTLSVQRKF
jgi:outer membrane receptor protein involved in Fe transport